MSFLSILNTLVLKFTKNVLLEPVFSYETGNRFTKQDVATLSNVHMLYILDMR
jgi:hypothetical protein